MEPGDILLVEGNQRVSSAIKYLTQSTWSHAAFYLGKNNKNRPFFLYLGHFAPHNPLQALKED